MQQINSSTSFLGEEAHKNNNNDNAEFELERKDTNFNSSSETKNPIYFVLASVFEAIVVITLEAILFAKFKKASYNTDVQEGLTKGIPVYLTFFIFTLIFQVGIAWDAVYNKNTIQVIAFILFNLCCFSYAVFQFKQIPEALNQTPGYDVNVIGELQKIMIANPVIIGVCQIIYFYLGARLYLEFGWRIYKKIGADPDIRNMYRWYQIFLTILKLDIFFFLGFSIQFLVLVLQKGDAEYPLTIVALPLTCVVLVLAVYAVRHESKQLISLFFVGLAAGVAYFIFKIVRMYDVSQEVKYMYVKDFLTFFASVTLFLLLLTFITSAICCYNFGKGLKSHLLSNVNGSSSNENNNGRTLSLD